MIRHVVLADGSTYWTICDRGTSHQILLHSNSGHHYIYQKETITHVHFKQAV